MPWKLTDVDRLAKAFGWDALTHMSVSDDLRAAVAEAEAEIARRGLGEQYSVELRRNLKISLNDYPTPPTDYEWFEVATAPPEARVRAMLAVLGEG